jgi:hypothetical protein
MKPEPDLTPFRFAWRGALGGLIGPVGLVLFFVWRDPNPMVVVYLFPFGLVAAVGGAVVGAISGFIIGLFFTDGMRIGFVVRLAITLGISVLPPLVLVILFNGPNAQGAINFMILMTLTLGLMPAITTSPWGISKRKKGEVQ